MKDLILWCYVCVGLSGNYLTILTILVLLGKLKGMDTTPHFLFSSLVFSVGVVLATFLTNRKNPLTE